MGTKNRIPKILLLNTGGTLMSIRGERGLAPGIGTDVVISAIPSLSTCFDIVAESLMNVSSANIQPEDWARIARRIHHVQADYDGVVVIHGTDTLAYTAAALSFMLARLRIPVVVTGSQIPLQDDTTDAKRNIVDACIVAASGYAGVMVVFGGKIIRGSRASKVYSGAIEAFRSINYPDIGFASDQRIHFFREYIPPPPVDRPVLYDHVCPQVILLKIIPGVGGEVLDLIEERAYRGVVIESIGKGGLPTSHPNLLDRVKNLVDQGIPVAVTTQCTYQGTNLEVYKNGRETLETGVIPTYDMSIEAVVTKMMWTLGKTDRMPVIRKMMLHNYAGELNYEAENGNGVLSA